MKKIIHSFMLCFACLLLIGSVQLVQAAGEERVSIGNGATAKEINAVLARNADRTDTKLIVDIAPGTYQLTETLWLYSNTTINAADATFIKTKAYGAMIENVLVNDNGGYDATKNIEIHGGKWDSTPLMHNNYGTESFRFIHASDIKISHVEICNVPRKSHLIVLAGCQDVKVSDSKFYGEYDYKKNVDYKEAIHLDVVSNSVQLPGIQTDKGKVFWDDLHSIDITVDGCEIYNFSRGIGSHTAVKGGFSNITIKNCKIYDIADSAIHLFNYKKSNIIGNTIYDVGQGIVCYTDPKEKIDLLERKYGTGEKAPANYKIKITGNTIHDVNGREYVKDSAAIRIRGKEDRLLTGTTISGNTIYKIKADSAGRGGFGILVSHAPSTKILNNTKIEVASKNAITVQDESHNTVIKGNKGIQAGRIGISVLNSKACQVLSNEIKKYSLTTECHGILIEKSGGVSKTVTTKVKGNTIYSNLSKTIKSYNDTINSHGINVSSSSYTDVTGNNVNNSMKNGINIAGCYYAKVQSNTVAGAWNYGISVAAKTVDGKKVKSNYAEVSNNTVSRFNGIGIYVGESNNAKISENKEVNGSKGAKFGISVYKCYKAEVKDNKKIKGYKDEAGIKVQSCNEAKVTGNYVIARKGAKKEMGIVIGNSKKATTRPNNTITGYPSSRRLLIA